MLITFNNESFERHGLKHQDALQVLAGPMETLDSWLNDAGNLVELIAGHNDAGVSIELCIEHGDGWMHIFHADQTRRHNG